MPTNIRRADSGFTRLDFRVYSDGIIRPRAILEAAGVEFTNGDQPGVRLTKAAAAQSVGPARLSKRTVSAKTVRGKTARATQKKR
jgi:hypothetical protein